MATRVEHQQDRHRFEIFDGDVLAGYSEYTERGGVRDFDHTVTLPEFRGRGLAAVITEFALDDTRDAGLKVIASCSYVRDFIASSDKYTDLL